MTSAQCTSLAGSGHDFQLIVDSIDSALTSVGYASHTTETAPILPGLSMQCTDGKSLASDL